MVKASIEPATKQDLFELYMNMREADVTELWRANRIEPMQAVRWSFASSSLVWAGRADGELVCLFGVTPINFIEGEGAPWMLGTKDLYKHQRIFLKHCRQCVADMFSQYTFLHNYVDAENTTAIRWLKWLGFEIHDPKPRGPFQHPFHHFELRLPNV